MTRITPNIERVGRSGLLLVHRPLNIEQRDFVRRLEAEFPDRRVQGALYGWAAFIYPAWAS